MEQFEQNASKYIKTSYIHQGIQNHHHYHHLMNTLIQHHQLPKHGYDEKTIEHMITDLSFMDNNNFYSNIGVGEREGRIYSSLVYRRHYGLSHGIGRSGDLIEVQPKACGSSLLYKLTNKLVSHCFKIIGLKYLKECLVMPLATGMTIALALNTIKSTRCEAKYVIWSRIDQKSCFKAILFANMIPIVIDQVFNDKNELVTDVDGINTAIISYKPENITCIITTTSCFAPRQPDLIDIVAKLSSQYDIPHIVNNAYGLQSPIICKLINRAMTIGRVDAVIQSTDKNFMVPVGGAIVASQSSDFISKLSALYPGRANASPIIDLFITLLALGEEGYKNILSTRLQQFNDMKERVLVSFTQKYNGSILSSPNNDISLAVTFEALQYAAHPSRPVDDMKISDTVSNSSIDKLEAVYIERSLDNALEVIESQYTNTLDREESPDITIDDAAGTGTDATTSLPEPSIHPNVSSPLINKYDATFFGSMLFQREISGCRIVTMSSTSNPSIKTTSINGYKFLNWGSHCNNYVDVSGGISAYFTVAVAIGMKKTEIDNFLTRIEKVCNKFIKYVDMKDNYKKVDDEMLVLKDA